jgi:hypothetical protein
MPSEVFVQNHLSYAATDLQDFPRICLRLVEGGPDDTPEVRGEDRTIPYLDGQVYGNRRNHRLPIVIRGWVAGQGSTEVLQRADTAQARQELRVLFDPTGGPQTLHVETEDGVEWEIEAYPEGIVWQAPDQGVPTHRTVSIRLAAIDAAFWTPSGS